MVQAAESRRREANRKIGKLHPGDSGRAGFSKMASQPVSAREQSGAPASNAACMGHAPGVMAGVTMKIARRARLLLALTPLLAGCGDFWQAPSTSSTSTTTTATALSSGFFYVINQATSQIVAYSITSGTLNQIGAYTLAASPSAIAMSPGGGFLYVSTVAGIYLYDIGSNGALTLANNGGVVSSDPATAIAVDPSGAWLVDAVPGTSGVQVTATPINSSGLYTQAGVGTRGYTLTNVPAGQIVPAEQIAISGDDHYVFVAAGEGGTLAISFTAGNGNPLAAGANLIAPLNADGSDLSVAVDPGTAPRLLYIGETLASGDTTGGLRVFNYASLGTATLTQVAGSPFASGGLSPHAILPVATGDYVYVASGTGPSTAGNITGFSITASSGVYTVANVTTVATGIQPYALAEDSKSNFVLSVSEGGGSDLECYFFDTTTAGQLDDAINTPTGTDPTEPIGIAAVP
jgi:6-phosphogluconolactonase